MIRVRKFHSYISSKQKSLQHGTQNRCNLKNDEDRDLASSLFINKGLIHT